MQCGEQYKLMLVLYGRIGLFYVDQGGSFEIIGYVWGECNWATVIWATCAFQLGNMHNACCFETHRDSSEVQGQVEDISEDICQLICTFLKYLPWDAIWSSCLPWADDVQCSPDLIHVLSQTLMSR